MATWIINTKEKQLAYGNYTMREDNGQPTAHSVLLQDVGWNNSDCIAGSYQKDDEERWSIRDGSATVNSWNNQRPSRQTVDQAVDQAGALLGIIGGLRGGSSLGSLGGLLGGGGGLLEPAAQLGPDLGGYFCHKALADDRKSDRWRHAGNHMAQWHELLNAGLERVKAGDVKTDDAMILAYR